MLELIKDLGVRKDKSGMSRRWCLAKCSYCNTIAEHRTQSLKNKKSCGCVTHLKANNKHRMSGTRQYIIWVDMKTRCDNPNSKSYIRYGKRGISYCDKWKNFQGFWEDRGESYFETATIERKDNSKGYNPENCIWIPLQEQHLNRNKINTFKKRDIESYHRKVTKEDILIFGEKYLKAKYGEGKYIIEEMSKKLGIAVNTAIIYLAKYRKEKNECKINS